MATTIETKINPSMEISAEQVKPGSSKFTVRLAFNNAYEIREKLKTSGFTFDADSKQWFDTFEIDLDFRDGAFHNVRGAFTMLYANVWSAHGLCFPEFPVITEVAVTNRIAHGLILQGYEVKEGPVSKSSVWDIYFGQEDRKPHA